MTSKKNSSDDLGMITPRLAAVVLTAILGCGAAAAEAPGAAAGPARDASGAKLALGRPVLEVTDGAIVSVASDPKTSDNFVFLGHGRLVVDLPPDPASGPDAPRATWLDERIDEAFLIVTDPSVRNKLLALPPAAGDQAKLSADAARVAAGWRDSPDRRASGAEAALFARSVDDPGPAGYFLASCRTTDGRRLYVEYDPLRSGRLVLARFKEPGAWGTWTLDTGPDGKALPAGRPWAFAAVHHTIDLRSKYYMQEGVQAKDEVTLEALRPGRRAALLSLDADLAVSRVTDTAGQPLRWAQWGSDLAVDLGAPLDPPARRVVIVSYGGSLYDRLDSGVYQKRAHVWWHSETSADHLATFDVTVHWPRNLQLVASGLRVDGGTEGELRWERRVLDRPSRSFGFEIGDFAVTTRKVGALTIDVATIADPRVPSPRERDALADTIAKIADLDQRAFGPLPFATLTVATVAGRAFDASYGLASLPSYLVQDFDIPRVRVKNGPRIARSLAQQWWGQTVTWSGNPEGRLDDPLASFAMWLFVQGSDPAKIADGVIPALEPLRPTGDVALDVSDRTAAAFAGIGALIPPEALLGALRGTVREADARPRDPGEFFSYLATIAGVQAGTSDWHSNEAAESLIAAYKIAPRDGGGWRVVGRLDRVPHAVRHDALVRTGDGWDSGPTFTTSPGPPLRISALVVSKVPPQGPPVMIDLEEQGQDFALDAAGEPAGVVFDPYHAAGARVYDVSSAAKPGLVREAAIRAAAGQAQRAEAVYRQALAAPYASTGTGDAALDSEVNARQAGPMDGRIRFALAELAVDAGRIDAAEAELAAPEIAAAVAASHDASLLRAKIIGRIALHRGQAQQAYDQISQAVRLSFPEGLDESPEDAARRKAFANGLAASGGDDLILAAAAHLAGHDDVARQAMSEASARGADVTALKEMLDSRAGSPAPAVTPADAGSEVPGTARNPGRS
jgi:hypothetical protein